LKQILFVFSNPYVFESSVLLSLENLCKDYEVSVLLTNYYLPESLHYNLIKAVEAGAISKYEKIPAWNDRSLNAASPKRSWVKEAKFWRSTIRGFGQNKFDIVVAHTGSQTYDLIPLTQFLKPAGVALCAFPVHLPAAEFSNSFKINDLWKKIRRLRTKLVSRIIRQFIDRISEQIILRIFNVPNAKPREQYFSIIGEFPFDLYMFATRQDHGRFQDLNPELCSELVLFPIGGQNDTNQFCDDSLLILLDLPDGNMTSGTTQLIDEVSFLMSTHKIEHVHIRPHPRDHTNLVKQLRGLLKEKFLLKQCGNRFDTLYEALSCVPIVLGGSSNSIDICVEFAKQKNGSLLVYQSATSLIGPKPDYESTDEGTGKNFLGVRRRWPSDRRDVSQPWQSEITPRDLYQVITKWVRPDTC